MASDETPPGGVPAKFEVQERVVLIPGTSVFVVVSRQWVKGMWVYQCVREGEEGKSPPLSIPEQMLRKPDPPALGRAIFSR